MEESERILVARCGSKRFGLPLAQVQEIFELSGPAIAVPGAPPWVAGMVSHHGHVVLLVQARQFLGEELAPGRQAIMLRISGDSVGLVVDEVEVVRERTETAGAASEKEQTPLRLLDAASLQRDMEERLSDIDGFRAP